MIVPKSAELMRLPGIVYRPIVGLEPSEVAIAYRKDDDEPAVRALLQIAVEKMPSKTAPSSASRGVGELGPRDFHPRQHGLSRFAC